MTMRCDQIMKKNPECVTPDETALVAARKMRSSHIGFLPVCELASGKVAGTLTDRDLCIRVCAEDKKGSETKISEVMTREVITCRPEQDVSEAAELMAENHKSRIMVVDGAGKLVGVISLSDIATYDSSVATRTMREVSEREVQQSP
jgi:CBS domain-containing protein